MKKFLDFLGGFLGPLFSFLNEYKVVDDGVRIYLATLVELVGDCERSHHKTSMLTGAEMLSYLMELQGPQHVKYLISPKNN